MTLQKIARKFIALPRLHKQAIIAVTDTFLLFAALLLSFSLRLGEVYIPSNENSIWLFTSIPLIAIPIFLRFGLYRAIIRYIGLRALWAVTQAVSLYALLWGLLVLFARAEGIPRSVIIINWLVAILLIGGTRMIARWWLSGSLSINNNINSNRIRVAIYGAGSAGVQLASALSYSNEYRPVAFIDDKSEMHNTHVNSLRVYPFRMLNQLIGKLNIQEVFLAIPTASRTRKTRIIEQLEPYPLHVKTLPGMADLAGGQVKIEDIKEIDIEDLLGRDPVAPQKQLLEANIKNKTVMVTGAGGSIGSELCRQILLQHPKRLILFEQSEYALYELDAELDILSKNITEFELKNNFIVPILGSVLDKKRLENICKTFNVDTIYHAAAYKHVPLVEKNPLEAIRNNIFGTYIAAKTAIETGVDKFILISTDKAVRPTNVMGASKRFAELVLQGLSSSQKNTHFSMVRFGNVLGSSGSVVPRFREQIQKGGPVTVTHPDIIRYFMTIPEAAQLVIQAGALGTRDGGDVYLLDMGEPVKIVELARKMIHLSGFTVMDEENPEGDIYIEYTGLRPGEKLYEELLIGDNVAGTKHPRIFRAMEESFSWQEISRHLEVLEEAYEQGDLELTRSILLEVISGYKPDNQISDLLWEEKHMNDKSEKPSVVQLKDYHKDDKAEGAA